MKSTNDLQTSNPEMVTISRAKYEEMNARLASQDERISVSVKSSLVKELPDTLVGVRQFLYEGRCKR